MSRINHLNLEITLPNNLTGHVSILQISSQLVQRLNENAKDDKEDDDSDEEADVDLKSIYTIGQYLRVAVVSTIDESATGKGRPKIGLSLQPTETNGSLQADDLVLNATVMATIASVEDRGYVMDIGMNKTSAFLPKSEVDKTFGEERLQPGAVFLCSVTGKGANGKVIQLSLLEKRITNSKAAPAEATTINTFLPGTLADVLVSDNGRRGFSGKILGHLDATADLIHSGVGPDGADIDSVAKIGTRVKARVICTFPGSKEPKIGISVLPHIKSLQLKEAKGKKAPTDVLPISSLVEECKVRHVEPEIGLYVDLGKSGLPGFVHISRVKDGKIDALYETSGPYQRESIHKGRIVGYNEVDGLFQVSFQKTILEQQYIRLEDVPIGAVVTGEIEKLVINEDGVSGVILKIAEGVTGFVAERHLSDVKLQHPEKKFRTGMKVKARVLSKNLWRKRMRLTMKKTLVNSEAPVVKSYDELSIGMQVPGTIDRLQASGAHIQFYNKVRGFLPVSEMSEAYIRDPSEHFRLGQVVSVHVLDVDPETRRLVVSCKDPAAFGLDKQAALKKLQIGDFVSATVTQKTEDQVYVELSESGLKATLPAGHLTDKSASKSQYALKHISVGQTLSELMVIDKHDERRAIVLTKKPSLVAASQEKNLLTNFGDAKEGKVVPGFVRNITPTAVFVQFAGGIHALLPRARLSSDAQAQKDFGMFKGQSIETRIISVIQDLKRLVVAPASGASEPTSGKTKEKPAANDSLEWGSITKARITSVKDTQLNVQIVDSNVQGRIDISNFFDSWDQIEDVKDPLSTIKKKQQLKVRVLGVHDAKDHRFLPITHRSAHSVLELTAKTSDLDADKPSLLSLDKLKVGDIHIAFVNNVSPQHLWVNLAPNVRGRVPAIEATDDVSQLGDLAGNFPVGSALKVRVTAVDAKNNHLDLSARTSGSSKAIEWASLKPKMILPGVVTKVNERQVMVKLSETVSGPVHLPDMADNYSEIDNTKIKNRDVVRVSVVNVDPHNKKIRLSMRPSRIMSSTLPVVDKEITQVSQLSSGDIVRGFVKNITDKGLFVLLGGQVSALVKIANLSDRFLKEWKDSFQVDQLVKGRVIAVDPATKQVELSLKNSVVNEDYTPPLSFSDIKKGQVITGKVRSVQDFGAFIVVDNSANVSGLAHRSQMAEKPVADATKLYKEGDLVKAYVLDVKPDQKRISFGLKPSLFEDDDTDMESDDGAALEDGSEDGDVEMRDGGASLKIVGLDEDDSEEDEDEEDDEDEDEDDDDEDMDSGDDDEAPKKSNGLAAGKKHAWSADPFDDSASEDEDEAAAKSKDKSKKKQQRKKNEIEIDRTAELDVNGPQTSSDYERLLLGQPDSSELWIAYMAFQMQVSELSKAREVAERAIKSINIREETEKLNVWVAYLNLEVVYGNKQTVEDVFKRACQYNDEQEVHERLASIYIQSDKLKVRNNHSFPLSFSKITRS